MSKSKSRNKGSNKNKQNGKNRHSLVPMPCLQKYDNMVTHLNSFPTNTPLEASGHAYCRLRKHKNESRDMRHLEWV